MGKMGTNDFLITVGSKLGGMPKETLSNKMKELKAGSCTLEDVYSLIDPTSDKCIVEWALVATSMFGYTENHTKCDPSEAEYKKFCKSLGIDPSTDSRVHPDCSFWEFYTKTSYGTLQETVAGLGYSGNYLVMDSWWSAQYNLTTKKMYKFSTKDITDNDYVETLVGKKFFLMTERNKQGADQQKHAGTLADYQDIGKLSRELYNYAGKVAAVAHDTHEGNYFCGVATSKGMTQADFATPYNGMYESNMATCGGISVYIATIDDPGIPVYYYTYDPDKPGEGAKLTTTERDGF